MNDKILAGALLLGFLIGMMIGVVMVQKQYPEEVVKGYQAYNRVMDRDVEMTIGNKSYMCTTKPELLK